MLVWRCLIRNLAAHAIASNNSASQKAILVTCTTAAVNGAGKREKPGSDSGGFEGCSRPTVWLGLVTDGDTAGGEGFAKAGAWAPEVMELGLGSGDVAEIVEPSLGFDELGILTPALWSVGP